VSPSTAEEIQHIVERHAGLLLKPEKALSLARRLGQRAQSLGEDLSRYLRALPQRPQELALLISLASNHETYFFRERAQLEAFQQLLPSLREDKLSRGLRSIRVLSAGCASGQEPYTLNILLRESGLFEGFNILVVGIDIDARAIQEARKAVYGENSLRLSRPGAAFISRYFHHRQGRYVLKEPFREGVSFRVGNLLEASTYQGLSNLDFIFARNFFIYMADWAIRQVAQHLYRCLSPQGWLFTATSEALHDKTPLFKLMHLPQGGLAYRRS
jgi:chemotaxis protein methyltransferase CheR